MVIAFLGYELDTEGKVRRTIRISSLGRLAIMINIVIGILSINIDIWLMGLIVNNWIDLIITGSRGI